MSVIDRILSRPLVTPKTEPKKWDPDKPYDRGVGYCRNPDCDKFNKDSLMFGVVEVFICGECRAPGLAVKEIFWSKDPKNLSFSEVRIEYDYKPYEDRFGALAIVRDESNPGQNVYNVQTPLLRTQKQALKVAEGLLGNLAQFPEDVFSKRLGSRPKEIVIDFDLPKLELKAKLKEVGERLARSDLARKTWR